MSENLFEKLNKQSETIDQVAEKLDGVSIIDLYALAKRTWDYRDYEMAQKYYNHISLLSPLEWEAPFRASLCGCLGVEKFSLWDRRPKMLIEYYQSTIKYIHSRDLSQEKKIQAFIQATEIMIEVLKEYIRMFLEEALHENLSEEVNLISYVGLGLFGIYLLKAILNFIIQYWGHKVGVLIQWDAT